MTGRISSYVRRSPYRIALRITVDLRCSPNTHATAISARPALVAALLEEKHTMGALASTLDAARRSRSRHQTQIPAPPPGTSVRGLGVGVTDDLTSGAAKQHSCLTAAVVPMTLISACC